MSDPADKSDDLIAELAKLMAASPGGNQASVTPIAKPAPLDPQATSAPPPASAAPTPIRIPGMDQPRPATPPAGTGPVAARAPVTGAIRIPGMDSPAPVSTSAPVSKFDFGAKPAPVAPIKQEPLSTLTERLAAQNPAARTEPTATPAAAATPVRIPSDLKPVSENRSFAQGPALTVAQPTAAAPTPSASVAPASSASDFHFDFGLTRDPAPAAPPPAPEPQDDPIGDLIAAEIGDDDDLASSEDHAEERQQPRPAPVTPIQRTTVTPQAAPPKPAISQVTPAAPRAATSQPIPLKPVSVAPRATESDRFAISPGVGLTMKPPAGQPLNPSVQRAPEPAKPEPSGSDPMSEIESLIGEAVRVELAPPGPVKVQSVQRVAPHVEIDSDVDEDEDDEDDETPANARQPSQPAPVVPPLGSQFAPRRAGLKDEGGSSSAEDAILAAAAASGADVDRIDPPSGDESPYRRLKVKPARSSWASGGVRQYVGMAVAGTLLLAAGLGLYWVLNMGRTNTLATGADAPVLTADATPVKELPSVQPSAEANIARSPVLEQMGGTSAEPSAEQLVSTDETKDGIVPRDVTQVADTDTDTEGGLANRKVRTVTVRPDGTIVSGDDAVAGAQPLPVDRPNVPAVPAASETPNLLGDTTSVAMTDPVDENTALTQLTPAPLTGETSAPSEAAVASGDQPTFDPTIVAPRPLPVPVRRETVTAFAEETPDPAPQLTGAQTPNGQIDLLGGTIEQPVAVAATPPVAVDEGSAAAYVQLSSSPTEADAQASRRTLTNRYGSLLGGNDLVIQSADLGQKGTWYRVKLPAASLADAQSICANIKANGGDCIVSGR